MSKTIYSKEELYSVGQYRSFDRNCKEAAFLLGGIGTGNISIGSRGQFRDLEIFNNPNKGKNLPYSFFAIWTKEEEKAPIAKILEGRLTPPFSKSHGFEAYENAGLPRFENSEMTGEYPLVKVKFKDKKMPVEVTLEAFTPFIPLNADDSGIPCAILKYKVKNLTTKKVDVTIAGSFPNLCGFNGFTLFQNLKEDLFEGNTNEIRTKDGLTGLYMYSDKLDKNHLKYGNLCISTKSDNITAKPVWYIGSWWDNMQDMWEDFCDDGKLELKSDTGFEDTDSRVRIGTIGSYKTLQANEEKEFTFILSWYFPNRVNGWYHDCSELNCNCDRTRNYYATKFSDAWDVACYVSKEFDRLYKSTMDFHDALFNSSLPDYVIDAAASNITVLRSTTCFRLENGKFFGWEGCFADAGSCDGNCTHVWNYAHTVAFLFPELEREMRTIEFNVETDENGKMEFRTKRLFGGINNWHPAADGQLGCIIRLYREWKLSGDTRFLKSVWNNAKKALDFAFTYWDSDGDFVLDSQQHNTYDIEFYGPNSLTNSMFYAALKAAAEMAEYLGDTEYAKKYNEAYATGSDRMDKMLWGGEYYIQVIEDVNKYKYQYGKGCLADQLFGQLQAHVAGVGYILPEEHVKKAIHAVFENNFMTDFYEHMGVQRVYALNDEKGLVLCSWPHGGRPKFPFVYSDEVWTGVEYQVAAHLIFEGFVDEGLTVIKAVRDRHDGIKRNPWNEVECGNHYARSMASWAPIIALSGYKCDLVKGEINFAPVFNRDNFSCFFSCGIAWGIYSQSLNSLTGEIDASVKVLYGSLDGVTVKANGKEIEKY